MSLRSSSFLPVTMLSTSPAKPSWLTGGSSPARSRVWTCLGPFGSSRTTMALAKIIDRKKTALSGFRSLASLQICTRACSARGFSIPTVQDISLPATSTSLRVIVPRVRAAVSAWRRVFTARNPAWPGKERRPPHRNSNELLVSWVHEIAGYRSWFSCGAVPVLVCRRSRPRLSVRPRFLTRACHTLLRPVHTSHSRPIKSMRNSECVGNWTEARSGLAVVTGTTRCGCEGPFSAL